MEISSRASLSGSVENAPSPAITRATNPGTVKVSQQFESILLRQFLGESAKSLLSGGPSGEMFGFLLTDTLACSLSEGGGLGLSSVLQAQLGVSKP